MVDSDFVKISQQMSQQAEQEKNKGNEAFKNGLLEESIKHYSNAIKYDPENYLYYSNRSAAYQKLKDYDRMVRDAQKCVEWNPKFLKGYFRLAKGYQVLHHFTFLLILFSCSKNTQKPSTSWKKL